MDRIFKPLFSMTGAISQDRERCQFLFWLMKNPMFYRAARPESGREARERFLRAALGRTQSERAIGWHWQAVFGCQTGRARKFRKPCARPIVSRPRRSGRGAR